MYISLHNRSAYSFGTALTRPRELVEFAAAHGMAAVALTDLHGLYAAVSFQQAGELAGIKLQTWGARAYRGRPPILPIVS